MIVQCKHSRIFSSAGRRLVIGRSMAVQDSQLESLKKSVFAAPNHFFKFVLYKEPHLPTQYALHAHYLLGKQASN
jgi:hypothetical protein